MTEHKKIENLLRTAKFESNQDVNKSVLKNLLERLDRDNMQVSEPGIGRKIMQSKLSKFVAAAVVIIIVYSGINYWGGNSNRVALGAIVESMQNMNWVCGKKTATKEEYWVCFNLKIEAMIDYKGGVRYIDYSKETVYIYQPDSKTITISPIIDRINETTIESPIELVQVLVKQFNLLGSKVSSKRAIMNNKRVEVFSMVNAYQEATLIVDSDKNLPVSMSTITHLPGTNDDISSSFTFDYPENGPMDIFSLGVPKDAQIIDNRPQGDTKKLLDEIQERYDEDFEDHVAVVLESFVRDNMYDPIYVYVMRQKGKYKRLNSYFAFDLKGGTNISSLYSKVIDKWPELTIQNVLDLEENKFEDERYIYDGTTTIRISKPSGKEKVSSINNGDLFQIDYGLKTLANLTRFNPKNLMPSNPDMQVKFEIIPEDPNHLGLIGLSSIATMNIPNNPNQPLPGTTTRWRIKKFWFDPAKDYLLIERINQEEWDGGILQSVRKTIEAAQTESGKWYPKVIVTETSQTGTGTSKTRTGKTKAVISLPEANGKNNIIQEQRILVDTNPVFEEGAFEEIKASK